MEAGLETGADGENVINLVEGELRNATSIVITQNLIMAEISAQEEQGNMTLPGDTIEGKHKGGYAKLITAQVRQYSIDYVTKYNLILSQTSSCLNINIPNFHLDTKCIQLSNTADDAFNGLYKRYSDTLYVHTNSARNLILKYGYDNGWNGCHGNETSIEPGCFPYRMWAYLADLSIPITGAVNPWSKTGDSSGYIPCGKYKNSVF